MSLNRLTTSVVLSFAILCVFAGTLVRPEKSAKNLFLQQQQLAHSAKGVLGKTDRWMDVQIHSPDLLPSNTNENIILHGEVHLRRHAIDELQLHWELPTQAILVKGELNPVFRSSAGDTQTFEITVRGLSWQQANHLILLHARASMGGQIVGASGVFPDENLKDIADASLRQQSMPAKPHAAPVLATSALLQF